MQKKSEVFLILHFQFQSIKKIVRYFLFGSKSSSKIIINQILLPVYLLFHIKPQMSVFYEYIYICIYLSEIDRYI